MAEINPAAAAHLRAHLASTSNLNTAPLVPAVDGEGLLLNRRILRTGQTTASENGLYVVSTAAGNLVSGSYSGGGTLSVNLGVTGIGFVVVSWGNATSFVINGVTYSPNTVASNGVITSTATTLTLSGPNSTASTADIRTLRLVAATDNPSTIGTQVNVTNGANNSGTWVLSATNTWTLISGATTINTSGSSGASNQSQLQVFANSAILNAGTIANLRTSGPGQFPGNVMTIDGSGASKVVSMWKWSATATGTDDGATIITPAGYGSIPGRYLINASL